MAYMASVNMINTTMGLGPPAAKVRSISLSSIQVIKLKIRLAERLWKVFANSLKRMSRSICFLFY